MNGSKKNKVLSIKECLSYLDLPIEKKAFSVDPVVYERYYLFFAHENSYFYSINKDNTALIYHGLLLLLEQNNATIT
jgi:hypothetical protein